MKSILIVFISFLMLTCNSDKPKLFVEKYPTGNIKTKYYKIHNKIQDSLIEYFPSGKIKKIRMYQNDVLNGRTQIFYDNGQLKEVMYYVHGKKENGDTVFYPSGKIELTAQYTEDRKNGIFQKWNEKDSIEYTKKYVNDTLIKELEFDE